MVWHRLGYRCWGFVHVIAGAVGISALVMASAEAFTLLKRVGAVYLIWLGSRHGPKPRSSIRSGWRVGGGRAFWEGIIVEVLNPKTDAILSPSPAFIDPTAHVARQFVIIGTVSVVLNTAVNVNATHWAATA